MRKHTDRRVTVVHWQEPWRGGRGEEGRREVRGGRRAVFVTLADERTDVKPTVDVLPCSLPDLWSSRCPLGSWDDLKIHRLLMSPCPGGRVVPSSLPDTWMENAHGGFPGQ